MPGSTCRWCGAPIRWARTESGGRMMPVNPQPDRGGNVALISDGVARQPMARVLAGAELMEWRGQLWMPHVATCTQGKRPMRPRRSQT